MAMLQRRYSRIVAGIVLISPILALALAWRSGGQSAEPEPTVDSAGFHVGNFEQATAAGSKPSVDWAGFEKTVRPFFAKHCFECHSGKNEKGEVRLDLFQDEGSLVKGLATVEKARDMLAKHAM